MAAGPKPTFFASPDEFGGWLAEHGDEEAEVVVGYWKVGTGKPSMTWAQSVEQALRFGWIDGVRRSLGGDSYCIRFTPRKPGSHWSAVNVRLAKRLVAEGRMRPAGAAAFSARRADRTATASYEQRKDARFAGDDLRRLKAEPKAWSWLRKAAPSYQRGCAWWVQSAKRPETRRRRLDLVIRHSALGETLPQWRWAKKAQAAKSARRGKAKAPAKASKRRTR